MNDDDLKKIGDLIDSKLRPIKDLVEISNKKATHAELMQALASDQTRLIKDQQSIVNEKLDKIQKTQDNHTESLVTIEATIKSYGDMYKINKDDIQRLGKRVTKIEDDLDIKIDPDLQISSLK